MHSARLIVLAIAAATAAANSVTTILDASTAQHISIETDSGFSRAEDVTVPVVSASITQSSRTDVDAATTDVSSSDASASTIGVTRFSSFPNATSKTLPFSRAEAALANINQATLASSVAPTKSQNTTTPTSHVTGGAIPQQMQSSMAGLIGFCIMGLIML
ncbi:hypothetical protein V8C35DRAFT_300140 [Trichoderma chlorosporum]